jgi:hypothetical protein
MSQYRSGPGCVGTYFFFFFLKSFVSLFLLFAYAFKHQRCGSVEQGSVHNVGVAGDPANVGHACVHIARAGAKVKQLLMRQRRVRQITRRRVNKTLFTINNQPTNQDKHLFSLLELQLIRTCNFHPSIRPKQNNDDKPSYRTNRLCSLSNPFFPLFSDFA